MLILRLTKTVGTNYDRVQFVVYQERKARPRVKATIIVTYLGVHFERWRACNFTIAELGQQTAEMDAEHNRSVRSRGFGEGRQHER